VISSGETVDREVSDKRGSKYLLRVLPYQATDHKIDGAMLTLIAIPTINDD